MHRALSLRSYDLLESPENLSKLSESAKRLVEVVTGRWAAMAFKVKESAFSSLQDIVAVSGYLFSLHLGHTEHLHQIHAWRPSWYIMAGVRRTN